MSGSRPRGFTLIEVLVALIIVAFGMGAVMTALTSAANNTIQMRERSFAEWVGLNQLATARLVFGGTPKGVTDDDLKDVNFANSRWHFRQVVTDVPELQIPGLRRITVQVRRAEADRAKPTRSDTLSSGDNWLATVTGFSGTAVSSPASVILGW